MVQRLVSFALNQPLFLILLTLLFIAGGLAAFNTLPIEAYPDVGDVQATVITLFPGHAPEEVEKQVTIPLEIGLSGLPHSVRLFSHTQFGLSYLVVTFDDQVDDYFVRQQVLERLQGINGLPPDAQPSLAPLSTAIGEIYRYRIKGDKSPTELRSIQDWTISRTLKTVPGVADITTLGGFIKQYEVNIDPQKMGVYKLTLQQVLTALNRGNANGGGGYIEQGSQQYIVRGIGLLHASEDIGNIVVDARNGTPILIKDIAAIAEGSVPRQGTVGQDDENEVVTGIVLMRKGENSAKVLVDIKEKIAALNKSILPPGVKIVPFYDRTQLLDTTLHTVFKNLLEGALLVGFVLFLFLGSLRAAGIVALMIPLSLLATFIGLRLRGIPANLLSLGAMDFGIIVDGAVIVVENIFRTLSETKPSRDKLELKQKILDATIQVGRPTLFSMLIIIIAHVPIFTLQRHEGRIFAPMAYTVISALIGSLLFSLTLVPLLCYFLLGASHSEHDNFLVAACKRIYSPLLNLALRFPKSIVAAAVVALGMTLSVLPFLGSEFLPELNEGTMWLNVNLPPSMSLTEVTKTLARVRAIVKKFPEVTTIISKAGRPEDGTDPKMLNMAEAFVDIKPQSEWTRNITKDQLIDEIGKSLDVIPGIEVSFSQPIRDNVLESISQIDGQIVIKVFGDDAALLKEKGDAVLHTVLGIKGVSRAFIDRGGEVPQLQITIQRAAAARYGLNVSDVEDVIDTTLGGRSGTEIWEGEKKFGVVVRLPEAQRRDMEAIRNLPIDTPSGARVPLSQLATIEVKDGKVNISRESGLRVTAIGVFISGRDMGSIVDEGRAMVASKVPMPPGFYVVWGGEFENQERAMKRLSLIVPISIFLIFALLFNAFDSIQNAVLILLNIPFAAIGGVLALYFTGIPLSVSAAIGFIALMGQAVLNGVVMVSYFNQLVQEGMSRVEAVRQGSLIRLRTVLMTALLAMLGLLPMALSKGIGSEVQKPLAVVVIGGLVSATALTLMVLPALYILIVRPRKLPPPGSFKKQGAENPLDAVSVRK